VRKSPKGEKQSFKKQMDLWWHGGDGELKRSGESLWSCGQWEGLLWSRAGNGVWIQAVAW